MPQFLNQLKQEGTRWWIKLQTTSILLAKEKFQQILESSWNEIEGLFVCLMIKYQTSSRSKLKYTLKEYLSFTAKYWLRYSKYNTILGVVNERLMVQKSSFDNYETTIRS